MPVWPVGGGTGSAGLATVARPPGTSSCPAWVMITPAAAVVVTAAAATMRRRLKRPQVAPGDQGKMECSVSATDKV